MSSNPNLSIYAWTFLCRKGQAKKFIQIKGARNSLSGQLSGSLVPEVQLNSLKIMSLFLVPLNLFGDGSIYNIYIIINSSYLTPNIFTIKIKMLAIFYSNFVVLFFLNSPFHLSLSIDGFNCLLSGLPFMINHIQKQPNKNYLTLN